MGEDAGFGFLEYFPAKNKSKALQKKITKILDAESLFALGVGGKKSSRRKCHQTSPALLHVSGSPFKQQSRPTVFLEFQHTAQK
jgi:hypothetical protein